MSAPAVCGNTRELDFPVQAHQGSVRVLVGGIAVSFQAVESALSCLRSAPGLMIRQPLLRIGNPLAECNYHYVAAPYRVRFVSAEVRGKGAAGRHIAKLAFCAALADLLSAIRLDPAIVYADMLAEAYSAFSSDSSYGTSMASAAVAILAKRHAWEQRGQLRQSVQQAVASCAARPGTACTVQTACGTGRCPFASPAYAGVTVAARPGKHVRPAIHAAAGTGFSIDEAAAELDALAPYHVVALCLPSPRGHPRRLSGWLR